MGKKSVVISEDESPKLFDVAKMRLLKPVFREQGTVTAANASGLSDGAASVIVASEEACRATGCRPLARILGYASVSGEPEWFILAPIDAISALLQSLSLEAAAIDLFEINEAFAVVPFAAMQQLGIPHEKLNFHCGAIALGHPRRQRSADPCDVNPCHAAAQGAARGRRALYRRRRSGGHCD